MLYLIRPSRDSSGGGFFVVAADVPDAMSKIDRLMDLGITAIEVVDKGGKVWSALEFREGQGAGEAAPAPVV